MAENNTDRLDISEALTSAIAANAADFDPVRPKLDELVKKLSESRVVLLGESTHGTKEFYDVRAALTMRLVREAGFNLVALEADWPDVEVVNDFIHHRRKDWESFHRFPEWMWRNHSFARFVKDMWKHNSSERHQPVSVFGLDLYSLYHSLEAVQNFFERYYPESAEKARSAKNCLEPWRSDPSRYGFAAYRDENSSCEPQVLELLRTLHENSLDARDPAPERSLLSALQNARVAINAEEYYRTMFKGSVESWNLRDRHMFETVLVLLDHFGPSSKIIIWEHNSHLGDARATQMGDLGELNLGQLCRARFGNDCRSVGFFTNTGTVAAASEWGGDVEIKHLNPVREDSVEAVLKEGAEKKGVGAYALSLDDLDERSLEELRKPRLERAVGVLYLPETERYSHYFDARLADQFDDVVWIGETRAVDPLKHVPEDEEPDTYPSGL